MADTKNSIAIKKQEKNAVTYCAGDFAVIIINIMKINAKTAPSAWEDELISSSIGV